MKKHVYLFLEIKRILKTALHTFAGAIVLAVIVGTVAFCAQRLLYGEKLMGTIRIGMVMDGQPGGNLGLAMSFLENMDSVKANCEFVYMDEDAALQALENRELSAVMIVPDTLVGDIIDGTNTPVKVLFSDEDSLTAAMLQELTTAGARTLGAAQAGIYAVSDLYWANGLEDHLQDAYDALNKSYLNFALARSRAFHYETVSVAGELSPVRYYMANGLLLFLMLSGMGLAGVCRREKKSMLLKLRAVGITPIIYTFFRFLALWLYYFILTALLLALLFWKSMSFGVLFAAAAMLSAVISALFMAFYQLTASPGSGMLLNFGVCTVGMILSGGVFPSEFFPEGIRKAGNVLPTGFMLEFIHGAVQNRLQLWCVWPLVLYALLLLTAAVFGCMLWMGNARGVGKYEKKGRRQKKLFSQTMAASRNDTAEKPAEVPVKHRHLETSGNADGIWILCSAKRYFKQKAFLVIFAAFFVIMLILGLTQKETQTGVPVAVWVEDTEDAFSCCIQQRLLALDGIIDFYPCDSLEELKADVAAQKAECGYVLPKDLKAKLDNNENKNLMETWISPAAVASKLVDEVVFSCMFEEYAPYVYGNYLENQAPGIDGLDVEAEKTVQKAHMEDGSTFSFVYNRTQGETYTKKGIFGSFDDSLFAAFIFMSILLGGYLSVRDRKRGVYGRLGWKISGRVPLYNMLVPAVASAIPVLFCRWIIDGFGSAGTDVVGMTVYVIFALGYSFCIYILFKDEKTYAAAVLLLTLGSLLSVFIQAGLGEMVPVLKIAGKCFPPAWFVEPSRQNLWIMAAVGVLCCILCPKWIRRRK